MRRLASVRRTIAVLAIAGLVVIATPSLEGVAALSAPSAARPFAANSPFNLPVVANPVVDGNSTAMVARAARDGMAYANLVEFGIPIFLATSSTPRFRVTCTMSPAWGTCPLAVGLRPVPTAAAPNVGSDGVMTVIDSGSGTVDEYWQARRTGSGWTTSWGAINSLSGSGWGGSSTGSGASRLAGVVRVAEIRAGVINHALVLQSDTACAGTFRPPALKTDGESTRSDCIPEGARLQLDPSINLAAIPGITPGERAVGRALQIYGAYLIDRADAPLSVSFELAPDASATSTGAVYSAAGLSWDYYGMPKIPWNKLRVLNAWNT